MEHELFVDIVEDLGMNYELKRPARFSLVRCNICKNTYKANTGNVKNRGRTVCLTCGPLLNRKSKIERLDHPLYVTWNLIKRRVDNTTVKRQGKDYHYIGISMCEEWKDFNVFTSWAEENGWKKGLTIDRIDNYKGYYPENCRWVDRYVQAANKKNTNTATGYTGITLSGRETTPYTARVSYKGKLYLQKRFKTLKGAVEARNKTIIDNKLPNTLNKYKGDK